MGRPNASTISEVDVHSSRYNMCAASIYGHEEGGEKVGRRKEESVITRGTVQQGRIFKNTEILYTKSSFTSGREYLSVEFKESENIFN